MTAPSKEDREKFDHSAHPTTHRVPDDLRAPGGGSTERPESDEYPMNDPLSTDSHRFVAPAAGGEAREMRIAELAYENAQSRGFAPGYELDDWLAAEKQLDRSTSPSDGVDNALTPNLSGRPTLKSLEEKTPDTGYVTTEGIRKA